MPPYGYGFAVPQNTVAPSTLGGYHAPPPPASPGTAQRPLIVSSFQRTSPDRASIA